MAGKVYKPGDLLPWRLRSKEDPAIVDWINIQDEIADAIRFCVEEEIRRNGLRNLAQFIPAKRPLIEVGRVENLPSASPASASQALLYQQPVVTSQPVQGEKEKEPDREPVKPVKPVEREVERYPEAPAAAARQTPPIPGISGGSKGAGSSVEDW